MSVVREVASYHELEEFVAQLPAPEDGRVRVFRGQVKEYLIAGTERPSISPSILRTSWHARDLDPVWLTAVSAAIQSHLGLRDLDEMDVRDIWAPAILQHYGARSAFVDVTRDLQIALWFALHEFESKWVSVLPPLLVRGWAPDRLLAATYRRSTRPTSAVIYVLDAPRWNRLERSGDAWLSRPEHGGLVEVSAGEDGRSIANAALRLARQNASLLWCDPRASESQSVDHVVVARFRLRNEFDDAGAPRATDSVSALFPPPREDRCYEALLDLPMTIDFNPEFARHPLDIPLYVSEGPTSSPSVSGDGSLGLPVSLGPLEWAAEASICKNEIASYVRLIPRRSPMLLHRELLSRPINDRVAAPMRIRGTEYAFNDALPILIDSPLWRTTSGVRDPEARRAWIESALQFGLPDAIDGRPTTSVYVELSGLDTHDAGQNARDYSMRGLWLVRSHDQIAVRAFAVVDGEVTALLGRFRWTNERGSFEPMGLDGLPPRPSAGTQVEADLLKSVFVILAVLRDLAPGYKPPARHARYFIVERNGVKTPIYQPGVVTEPPHGVVEWIPGTPYLRPRAVDGSTYAFASGNTQKLFHPDSIRERVELWWRCLSAVTDPYYSVAVAIPLAEHFAFVDDFDAGIKAVQLARQRAHSSLLTLWDNRLDVLEAQLQVSAGRIDAARRVVNAIVERAVNDADTGLAVAAREFAAHPVPRLWGRVTDLGTVRIVRPPHDTPAILFPLTEAAASDCDTRDGLLNERF